MLPTMEALEDKEEFLPVGFSPEPYRGETRNLTEFRMINHYYHHHTIPVRSFPLHIPPPSLFRTRPPSPLPNHSSATRIPIVVF